MASSESSRVSRRYELASLAVLYIYIFTIHIASHSPHLYRSLCIYALSGEMCVENKHDDDDYEQTGEKKQQVESLRSFAKNKRKIMLKYSCLSVYVFMCMYVCRHRWRNSRISLEELFGRNICKTKSYIATI